MNALGTHLLLELKDCDREVLNNLPLIKSALISAAEETGATILGESFHLFEPQGVTGVVAIAESHLCVHTWPEYGYAAVDIFTCGDSFKADKAAGIIIQRLGAKDPSVIELKRGIVTTAGLEVVPTKVGRA